MELIPGSIPLAPTRNRNRTRKASKTQWTPEEDSLLSSLVSKTDDWLEIATHFPNRTSKQVLSHWRKVVDPNIIRGSWTCAEDQAIIQWVATNGASKWAMLAERMPGRLAKQCRERWCNHLDPNIKRTSWTPEEDLIIIETIRKIGTKWADIARNLPGRTDNSVKNRWNSTLRRKKIEEIQSACENRNEQKNENIVSFELKCNIGINYASLNALMSSNVNPNISNPSNTNIRSDVHSNIHDVNSNMNGYDVGMYLNTEYSTSPITNRESNKSISGIDAHLFSSLNETSAGNGIGINMSYLMNKPHLCSENNNENILNNSRNNLLENRRRLSEMLELRKSQYIDSQTIC